MMFSGEVSTMEFAGTKVCIMDGDVSHFEKLGRGDDLGITVFRNVVYIVINTTLVEQFALEFDMDVINVYMEVLCHELAHVIGYFEEDNLSEEFADQVAVSFLADLGINSVICKGGTLC